MASWMTTAASGKPKRRNTRSADSRRAANESHKRLRESVIRFLRSLNVAAHKCDNGMALYRGKDGKEFRVPYGIVGWPDIQGVIVPTGVLLTVECKTGAGELTDAQRVVNSDLRDAGCLAYVIRDFINDADANAIRADVANVRALWKKARGE